MPDRLIMVCQIYYSKEVKINQLSLICHLQSMYIPMHDETNVSTPANLGLISPILLFRLLLLYEHHTSNKYFTAFSLFYTKFFCTLPLY